MQECPRHGMARHWPQQPTLLVPVPDEQLMEGLQVFLAAYGDRYDMTLCHFQLDGAHDAQLNIRQIAAMYVHEPSALQSRYDPPALCGDPIILIAQLQAIRDNARSFALAEGCPAMRHVRYCQSSQRGVQTTKAAKESGLLYMSQFGTVATVPWRHSCKTAICGFTIGVSNASHLSRLT
jgi:hypothetical protein